MSASIISGCDTSPVLEFLEHIFDFVSLSIGGFIVGIRVLRFFFGGALTFVSQSVPEPVGVIAAISQQVFGAWQCIQKNFGS